MNSISKTTTKTKVVSKSRTIRKIGKVYKKYVEKYIEKIKDDKKNLKISL